VSLLLGFIVETLGGELYGNPELLIQELRSLESAGPSSLSFLSHPKYSHQLAISKAGCVIVSNEMKARAILRGDCIVADDPYLYFAKLTQLWKLQIQSDLPASIHPSAVIDDSADIDPSASVGPLCVIERGAHVGANSVLKSRVTLGENCYVGDRCIIHSGVVIGADGFGFAPNAGVWEKIEQLGSVRVGNDVEIGANTCIDRGALSDTVIEDGVKLDNLIQIGHNVQIGKNTAMAGCVGVAGSTRIGAGCTLGGGAIVLGHLTLVNGVHVSAATVVTKSIHQSGRYTGIFPLDDNAQWEKNASTLKQLHSLRERIRFLETNLNPEKIP
jgi:UDP-3-O-[3-hydroxymyristoyl] glucosamine N-acyltransferase